jgi:hypothetical protein
MHLGNTPRLKEIIKKDFISRVRGYPMSSDYSGLVPERKITRNITELI